ncbi:excinuclease ABC subunit UvrC [Egicoccus halophilus]|uniref:UvrABC system protein C n=1 Tax=Egicoccus halophilus TaxID=1670830 RepID=A0A8J3A6C2_9ACTN|nr:excinuclease ABC subunit UvrC [Egicoccus halophilus]GGI04497.1 UvrABC system protein C [Egicoccus halophilus]
MRNPALAFRPEPGAIPEAPGCYQFKDGHGRVVYVGKAKSLRQRLGNYFQAWHNIAPRTRAMLEAARSVEWIVVDSEVEALHLEYTLIQRHRPRYNVRYRDDKSYPHLVLTASEEVPRARVQRGRVAKGDLRFGPYAHAYAIRETLDLLLRTFPVRTCSQGIYDRAARTGKPCLLHHIDRCAAPCVGKISLEDHRTLVERLGHFLDGETGPVLRQLEADMQAASAELNFEAAARLRDQLTAVRKALEKQQVVSAKSEDFDAIAIHEDELEAAVQAFFVRRGRLVGRKGWTVDKVEPLTTSQLLTSFVLQLYADRDDDIPPQVVVPVEPDDAEALSLLLAEQRRHTRAGSRGRPIQRVRFQVPQRGDKVAFLETVTENAREAFQRARLKRASDFESRSRALKELQDTLDLDEAPLRIECFDISHLGGTEVVGSMVVFEDGLPRKSDYRRFKLSIDRNDDFASMQEVIRRRFARLAQTQQAPAPSEVAATEQAVRRFAYPPNLVVIDGGVGQLRAALAGAGELATADVAFVGLAKKFEELWVPGRSRPVVLPRGSEALYLVQRVRDEAHRFAITYQRSRRSSSVASSALDGVAGVGPARRKALFRSFGSVAAMRRATVEELMAVPGVSRTIATAVHDHLHATVEDAP